MKTFDISPVSYSHIRIESYPPAKPREDRLKRSEWPWLVVIAFIVLVLVSLATWHSAHAESLTDKSVYSAPDAIQERTYCLQIKEHLTTVTNDPGESAINSFCAQYGV